RPDRNGIVKPNISVHDIIAGGAHAARRLLDAGRAALSHPPLPPDPGDGGASEGSRAAAIRAAPSREGPGGPSPRDHRDARGAAAGRPSQRGGTGGPAGGARPARAADDEPGSALGRGRADPEREPSGAPHRRAVAVGASS